MTDLPGTIRIEDNILGLTDSYKFGHWKQYPRGIQEVYSYFESRGGKWGEVVFYGLQYIMKRFLLGRVVTTPKIDRADRKVGLHFGNNKIFPRKQWEYIRDKHDGVLPISIRAVPEGTIVPSRNVLMTVVNTDPECYWLTNYLETLLTQIWYPCTVATQSRQMKSLILKYLHKTGNPDLIDWKLHDFGFRGVTCVEQAGIGGAAHLTQFKGTDTFPATDVADVYYGEEMAGFSIPAMEHSTVCSWGRDHEADAMQNMLEAFPTGPVACVSDTYDIFKACQDIWCGSLKAEVMRRDGFVVIRPDSGDPPLVIATGTPNVMDILADGAGYEVNEKGYKVLDPHLRVIQGDGIDIEMIDNILYAMSERKYSADNITFGSGGGLLQRMNRDTLEFAFKCSAVAVNGEEREVYKSPITSHSKRSKAGRMKLVRTTGSHGAGYHTAKLSEPGEDSLVEVFRNGKLLVDHKFSDIRHRARVW